MKPHTPPAMAEAPLPDEFTNLYELSKLDTTRFVGSEIRWLIGKARQTREERDQAFNAGWNAALEEIKGPMTGIWKSARGRWLAPRMWFFKRPASPNAKEEKP